MSHIIAYTYNAAMHCPECARESFRAGVTLKHPRPSKPGELYDTGRCDGLGVGLGALDREGNKVRPVFSTDEGVHGEHCDTCGAVLE